jgi:Protein of unknown function (DUF2442)
MTLKSRIPVVSSVTVVPPYTLDVLFDDGERRIVNVEPLLFGPVFEPLRDVRTFAEVRVEPEWGTVAWPNGADLAPEFLYFGQDPTQAAK